MAQVYGKAGKSAFAMGNDRYRNLIIRIVLPMASLFLLLWLGFTLFSRGYIIPGAALFLAFVGLVKFLESRGLPLKESIFHADTGAKAEQAVAEALESLPDNYFVFHDLEFPGFNIDHVVLGPNGIFLVETKSQKGTIRQHNDVLLRNGRKLFKDFLNQCWSQTFSLRDYLGQGRLKNLPISPILCFPNGYVDIRRPVRGVAVLNVRFLVPCILSRHDSVPDAAMEGIVPLLAKATSDLGARKQAQTTSSREISQGTSQRHVRICPKCGYERTKIDDLYTKEEDCPKCKVVYANVQTEDSSPRANPGLTTGLSHASSPGRRAAMGMLIAGVMSAALLYGAFKTIVGRVEQALIQPTIQTPIESKENPSLSPSQDAASAPSVAFPLTYAVAMTEASNTVPFVFTEDRGQNAVLLFFDRDAKQLVLRACVRAHEKLTTRLPSVNLGCVMTTGPSWHGFEHHFGHEAEIRKTGMSLKSQTQQGKVKGVATTSSALFDTGAPCSAGEIDSWIKTAFTPSGGFVKM